MRLCPKDAVPNRVIARRVAILVLELDFFQNPGLLVVRAVRSANPHAHLRRRIAAENGAILHEGCFHAIARRGNRRAKAGHPAADDADVKLVFVIVEMVHWEKEGVGSSRIFNSIYSLLLVPRQPLPKTWNERVSK